MSQPIKAFDADSLHVKVYKTRDEMGQAAAKEAIAHLRALLARQASVSIVFAAAPSQSEFLAALCKAEGIDWGRVSAFHMDEYIALPASAPQGFGNFLRRAIFGCVPFARVEYLNGNAMDIAAECRRYTALLEAAPPDIVFMGIGENGHIAFNDPPVANFSDPVWVKPVLLDAMCRQQQVNDGCFASLEEVPVAALTLTVSALMQGKALFCMVPAKTKRAAVQAAVQGPIDTACPASILRTHPSARLYVDGDSGADLL